jgi:hypothetical protein
MPTLSLLHHEPFCSVVLVLPNGVIAMVSFCGFLVDFYHVGSSGWSQHLERELIFLKASLIG